MTAFLAGMADGEGADHGHHDGGAGRLGLAFERSSAMKFE